MKISKIVICCSFLLVFGIFSSASAEDVCKECLSKVPQDMRDYVYNMDFMDSDQPLGEAGNEKVEKS